MQKRNAIINFLESEIDETIEIIVSLRKKINASREEIKALKEEIEVQENLQHALINAWEVINAFDDSLK